MFNLKRPQLGTCGPAAFEKLSGIRPKVKIRVKKRLFKAVPLIRTKKGYTRIENFKALK